MTADADTVFGIVSDLGNLTWLPPGVETELPGPGLLRLWIRSGDQDWDVERPMRIDWRRLRVEWGTDATASYAGWVQVKRLAPQSCVVSAQVTGLPGVPDTRIDAWLDDAFEALATVVRVEQSRA
jgi:hypothetical protein